MHYDIIGDIHGHLRPLEQLLLNLGYVPTNGTWSHPERKALFLGDYIDRGPEQLGVLELVRRMVDAGSAGAIQGNHEANACAYALRGPDGEFLRPHTAKNRHQHQAFLDAVGEGSKLHDEWIEWFLTLPLWQDLGSLRIVHACWHPDQIELLQDHVAPGNRYDRSRLPDYFTRGNPLCDAVEIILKGPEVPLPPGVVFHDKDWP
jgi:Calcineurin-like phosphoesterase.